MTDHVRFRRNSAGMRELLLSEDVERMLQAKGDRVKDAAEARGVEVNGHHGERMPMPYDTEVHRSARRVRVRVRAVHPAGARAEVKHRALGQAIDAAR